MSKKENGAMRRGKRDPLCIIAVILLGLVVSFASSKAADQTSKKEVQEEVTEAFQALQDYTVEQRDKAIEKVKVALEDLDAFIERMQDRVYDGWNQMDPSARRQARAAMDLLRRQRNELAEWYGGLRHSSAHAWDHVKQGFLDSYETLSEAFDDAEDAFTSPETDTTTK
jgi:hypothetical protein